MRRLMRRKAIQRFQIFEERSFKLLREFRQCRFIFADALDDFVLNVSDIHHVRDLEIFEFQITPDQIAEDEMEIHEGGGGLVLLRRAMASDAARRRSLSWR